MIMNKNTLTTLFHQTMYRSCQKAKCQQFTYHVFFDFGKLFNYDTLLIQEIKRICLESILYREMHYIAND